MSQPMQEPPIQTLCERRGLFVLPKGAIGHIVSVSGPRAVAVLARGIQSGPGPVPPRVQIGALLKIATPASSVMTLVTAVTTPMPASDEQKDELALVELNLVGEIVPSGPEREPAFRFGVTSPPTIGDPLLLADRTDLTRVFAPSGVATVQIGALYQDAAVPARLRVDDLLAKHFIVVGSTGSGKSCALTCILQRILEGHKYAHIVVMDIHNEYLSAFGDKVEAINLNNFTLPFWLLNFQELTAALTTADEHRDAEIEILSEGVGQAKRRYTDSAVLRRRKGPEIGHLSVETPTPFRLSDVIAYIDEQLGRLERAQSTLPYRKLKQRIETMIADQRYNFMFGSLTVQDTMTDILGRLFRVPGDGKPISVIDLSVVPSEILDVVISVISRLLFDVAVWSKGGLPTLLVCEEAHRYAPTVDRGRFVPTRQALAKIAKEGRKYGISLALVTQRPSELDPTILSQCSTVVALRLNNERDQQVMRSSAHESMMDMLEFLPLLGDREAVVMGQGVSLPMRVTFDDLDNNAVPRNLNVGFSNSWKAPNMDREQLDAIVARWRQSGRERVDRDET